MSNNLQQLLCNLLGYARGNLGLKKLDSVYAANQLYSIFKVSEPQSLEPQSVSLQADILDPLVDYAVREGLILEAERLLFETKIMGLVTPSPSAVAAEFERCWQSGGAETACKYLYDLSKNSNYIRQVDIDKNIRWTAKNPLGDLVITINLSKPEKDNKQVLLEKTMPKVKYPRCMLCLENIGYNGALNYPARQTLRAVPVTLLGEQWYVQFSPYVYYDMHCIAFAEQHSPMAVTPQSFGRLLDFVEIFPHFFIGSNADLPIVGGSILSHDHYQGGAKVLPMLGREVRKWFAIGKHKGVRGGILDWYNSVIRLTSASKTALQAAAAEVLSAWRTYSDSAVGILAHTDQPHNTITPIAHRMGEDFVLDLILRNNRTDDDHPHGIYHPTEDMHNIKKEGIGLIEAMGIFILPGRLQRELGQVADLLTETNPNIAEIGSEGHPLFGHFGMAKELLRPAPLTRQQADEVVREYVNATCVKILNCTAVFKNTKEGQQAFERFVASVGL